MKRIDMILNSVEGATMIDFNLLLESKEFKKLFIDWFTNKNLDDKTVIKNSIDFINKTF
tara:strand:+ start:452 stop:628 length:177 start_codon:yes stop_codon:yes gene_type:complete